MKRCSALARAFFGVIGLCAAAGCQTPRPPINRVQPYYYDKLDFIPYQYAALTSGGAPEALSPTVIAKEPVFYTQTTLIAKPTTIGFTGMTSYSEADKIRWEVSETRLVARQSYEFVKGAPTGAGGIGQNVQTGDPVAVFAITSHFDIINDYNPTTGEALNVVVENTTDRPWYMRRYMHVDWSQNLISGYNMVLAEADFDGKLKSEPAAIFVNTPNDPNAPVFEYASAGTSGGRKLMYFDVVNKAILHPETTYLTYSDRPGSTTTYSQLPVCYLSQSESSTDCAPAEVTFRVSFRRTDPARDYEPAPVNVPIPDNTLDAQPAFHHLDMERFGFFDQARVGYDPVQHATLDNNRMHFASRHNLWLHHHLQAVGADTATGCNADADCGDGAGVVCHIGNTPRDATHRGACAPLATAHDASDISCQSDDDCVQTINGTGQSATAFCDTAVHKCAEHTIRCGKDSECAAIDPNSTCDLAIAYTRADNRGLCLMPFLQRQVRPIAYHESPGYPDYMQPVTEAVVGEWNSAFVTAVTAARRHECEINRNLDASSVDKATNPCSDPTVTGLAPALGADARFVYVGCHNPVWGTGTNAGAGQHSQADVDAAHARGWDLPSCGPPGTVARLGDLRYSMIGSITEHDQQGYWGLANIASDPETGEMVAGRGAVWQTITDTYASYLVTLVQLLNGDLDPTSVSNGDYVVNAMKQLGTGKAPSDQVLDAPLRASGSMAALAGMRTGLEALALPGNGWFNPATSQLFSNQVGRKGAFLVAQQRLLDGRVLGDGTASGSQRLLGLAGTRLEGLLMNSQQALLAQTHDPDPTAALPQTLDEASPMRQQSVAIKKVIERFRSRLSAYECEYDSQFSDDMLLGLAQRLASGPRISASDPLDAPVAFGRDWDFSGGNLALMQTYAAQFIHHGVLAHELGHSLGQRHNFTASADAINYLDQYWKVRTLGHPAGLKPRYQYLADPADGNYYSPEEIAGRVDEYSYSSVMDYKGLNEDAHGLGRYDYAFIKNGYVGMVEAFRNVADLDAAITYSNNVAGAGLSTPLDLREFQTAGPHGMHYSQIPAIFGTNPDGTPNLGDDNRYDVFLRETESMNVTGWGPPAFTNVTSDGHLLVPYRFDTDERAGLVWQDQRYDAGPDAFESLHYSTERLLDYYFVNSFARLRAGFSTRGYVNRVWGRYLEQIHQCTQTLAFDLVNYQDFFGTNAPILTDPRELGGIVNRTAMSLTADTLTALLTMPEIGSHGLVPQFDQSQLVGPINGGLLVSTIALNDGRSFESNWRNDVGFFWYDELNSAGSYYDKVMAIQALTDPDLLLLQRDTPTDIRLFELSYYTMFPDAMIRLFGGLIAEDFQDFAPIINTSSGDIQRTHVTSLTLPPGTGANQSGRLFDRNHAPLDPQDHFTVQLWSIVHTMAMFPATYDQRYVDYARLWQDGSVEAIQVQDPAHQTVAWTSPFSGVTYRALHIGTAPGEPGASVGASAMVHLSTGKPATEAGVAARALLHLQDLEAARQAAIARGDVAATNLVTQQEHQYLSVIEALRAVTATFAHGFANEP